MSISEYNEGGGRLTSFQYPDPADDDKRLSYITLVAPDNSFTDFPATLPDVDKKTLTEIYQALTGQYTKFVLQHTEDNRVEKQQITPTTGDAFIATFTGREPCILGFQGYLVFDYSDSNQSWYHAFLNAYEYYLRASRLAKWRATIKLVIPDMVEYQGYMLNVSASHSADTDMIVPLSFSMLITNRGLCKPMVSYASESKEINKTSTQGGSNSVYSTPSIGSFDMLGNFTPSESALKDSMGAVNNTITSIGRDSLDSASSYRNSLAGMVKIPTTVPSSIGTSIDPSILGSTQGIKLFSDSIRGGNLAAVANKFGTGLTGVFSQVKNLPFGMRSK